MNQKDISGKRKLFRTQMNSQNIRFGQNLTTNYQMESIQMKNHQGRMVSRLQTKCSKIKSRENNSKMGLFFGNIQRMVGPHMKRNYI